MEDVGWVVVIICLLALTGSCGFKGCRVTVNGVPYTVQVETVDE